MLVIRKEQLLAFQRQAEEKLEEGLLRHFLKHYPRESRQAGGPPQMRLFVRQGIQRARALGLDTQYTAGFYVALMIVLGSGFEKDPQLPWAAEALADESLGPGDRIQHLFRTALDYLGATAGGESEFIVRAMLRIRAWDPATAPATSGPQWENDVCALFQRLYPQKYEYQGEALTVAMLRWMPDLAAQYGIRSQRGKSIYALHVFMLGGSFDTDLLHPWAARALKDPAAATEEDRIRLLWDGAMQHLNESLSRD